MRNRRRRRDSLLATGRRDVVAGTRPLGFGNVGAGRTAGTAGASGDTRSAAAPVPSKLAQRLRGGVGFEGNDEESWENAADQSAESLTPPTAGALLRLFKFAAVAAG